MKLYLFVCLLFCFSFYIKADAQVAENKNLFNRFHSINAIGIVNGSSGTSFMISSINGFNFRKVFVGAGVGYDNYYYRSVPFFIDGHYDLFGKKNKIQLVGNAGINLPLKSQNENTGNAAVKYKAGLFYETGFDYRMACKRHAFITGLSYSFKQVKKELENNVWNPVVNRIENLPLKYDYHFQRIVFRVGWEF
ncbi:MAG: hypothetical protein ABJA78_05280 [Ferruginibacter sp.]